jgi:hypothetical protein
VHSSKCLSTKACTQALVSIFLLFCEDTCTNDYACDFQGQSSLRKPSAKDRLASGKADSLQDQEYVLTYEDKDADWMLVGDLPWE